MERINRNVKQDLKDFSIKLVSKEFLTSSLV